MNSLPTPPNKVSQSLLGTAAQTVVHFCMVLLIASLIAWAVVPMDSLQALFDYSTRVPEIRSMNSTQFAIQLGLAACIWAMCVIVYKLIALHRAAPETQRLRVARGIVLTETLIIMPVFLLLTFGMAQLAINNMAGMLANVAVYEAARAVWVWQPEVDSGRVEADPADRARIAAAQVMAPVAPGGFTIIPTELSDEFKASRRALVMAQVPFGSMLPQGISDFAANLGSMSVKSTAARNLTFSEALDTSSFLRRTLTKYTHAYLATDIEIIHGDNLGAKLTYQHNQTMPIVGKIFGKRSVGLFGFSLSAPGKRSGYYSTMERTYTLKAQAWKPNPSMPNEIDFIEYDGDDKPGEADIKGDVRAGSGAEDDW